MSFIIEKPDVTDTSTIQAIIDKYFNVRAQDEDHALINDASISPEQTRMLTDAAPGTIGIIIVAPGEEFSINQTLYVAQSRGGWELKRDS